MALISQYFSADTSADASSDAKCRINIGEYNSSFLANFSAAFFKHLRWWIASSTLRHLPKSWNILNMICNAFRLVLLFSNTPSVFLFSQGVPNFLIPSTTRSCQISESFHHKVVTSILIPSTKRSYRISWFLPQQTHVENLHPFHNQIGSHV